MRETTNSKFLILLIIDRFLPLKFHIPMNIFREKATPFEVTRQDKWNSNFVSSPHPTSPINLCSSCAEFLTYLVSDWSRWFCPYTDTLLIRLSLKLVGQIVMVFSKSNLWTCSMEFRCILASDWLGSFHVVLGKLLIIFSSNFMSKLIMELS